MINKIKLPKFELTDLEDLIRQLEFMYLILSQDKTGKKNPG